MDKNLHISTTPRRKGVDRPDQDSSHTDSESLGLARARTGLHSQSTVESNQSRSHGVPVGPNGSHTSLVHSPDQVAERLDVTECFHYPGH